MRTSSSGAPSRCASIIASRRRVRDGGVAVHEVRRHPVGSSVKHRATPACTGRGQQRSERRASPLVRRVVPARLARGAPALARRAARSGLDAGGRMAVVARADHQAGRSVAVCAACVVVPSLTQVTLECTPRRHRDERDWRGRRGLFASGATPTGQPRGRLSARAERYSAAAAPPAPAKPRGPRARLRRCVEWKPNLRPSAPLYPLRYRRAAMVAGDWVPRAPKPDPSQSGKLRRSRWGDQPMSPPGP